MAYIMYGSMSEKKSNINATNHYHPQQVDMYKAGIKTRGIAVKCTIAVTETCHYSICLGGSLPHEVVI